MGRPLRLVDLTPKEYQDLKRIEFNPKLSEKVRLRAIIRVLTKTVPFSSRRGQAPLGAALSKTVLQLGGGVAGRLQAASCRANLMFIR